MKTKMHQFLELLNNLQETMMPTNVIEYVIRKNELVNFVREQLKGKESGRNS